MLNEVLVQIKPFVLLVVAIPVGLFVRAVGEWLVQWAKAPSEENRNRKIRVGVLTAILNAISNSRQYCEQIRHQLTAIPLGAAHHMVIIPSFNIDAVVLDQHASAIFGLLDELKAQQVMAVRLELAHVRRRVDRLADELLIERDGPITSMPVASIQSIQRYLDGTRGLLDSTILRCNDVGNTLKSEIASVRTVRNVLRPCLVIVCVLAFVAAVVWIATLPDQKH